MSGIRELFSLLYWVNNDKRTVLESSFKANRPVSKLQEAVEQSRNKVQTAADKHLSKKIKEQTNS